MGDRRTAPVQSSARKQPPSRKLREGDALQAENQRLKERVLQLEEQLDQTTLERDAYRHSLHAWAREQFKRSPHKLTAKDLERLKKDQDAVPLAAFIEELRQIAIKD